MSEFFAMGGYAVFIWPSYAVAFGVMAGLVAWAWISARHGEAEVERLRAAGLDTRRRTAGTGTADGDREHAA